MITTVTHRNAPVETMDNISSTCFSLVITTTSLSNVHSTSEVNEGLTSEETRMSSQLLSKCKGITTKHNHNNNNLEKTYKNRKQKKRKIRKI